MASIGSFDGGSSSPAEEMETNVKALPGSSSRDAKLESHTASNVVADGESRYSNEKMATNETDAPGSSNAEKEKYQCPQCPKQYKYQCGLNRHIRIHDKKKRIECDLCDEKFFATKSDYDKHMLTHTGERLHECPTCKQWFGQLYHLTSHQYLHLEEKTVKCPECPVKTCFQTPDQLRHHMLVHHKGKQHECSICHKEFHRKAELKRHQLIHTKVKEFQCGTCNKRFSRSDILHEHIRSHTGEKPYKCEKCGKCFTKSSNLKTHQKSCAKLMEKRLHKCLKCSKRYSHKTNLNTHMKTHKEETTK